jgi:hypothetical protein
MATKYECDICGTQFNFPEAVAALTVPNTYKGQHGAAFAKPVGTPTKMEVCASCAWQVGDGILSLKEDAKAKP